MLRPILILYIGFRYIKAKKRNGFISFISLSSMLGIALGITVLITVLSVMNGFDYEMRNKIFSMARQVTIYDYSKNKNNLYHLDKVTKRNNSIIASAPFISGQGMLSANGLNRGVIINGILPKQEITISDIKNTMLHGDLLSLKTGNFGIVLGSEIANYLGLNIGDKVVVMVPNASATPLGIMPKFKQFKIVGIFSIGEGFNFDEMTAFINLYDAQKLFGDNNVTGVNLKLSNIYLAPNVTQELKKTLGNGYLISDWTTEYGSLFKAISMEKTAMFVILLFIIAVAIVNLVSGLVMTVTDKQSDIAILRTLGASPSTIMGIFIVQGGIIGLIGVAFGVIGGTLLALNAPMLVKLLEQICHTQFISAGVYFIDYLPTRLLLSDVTIVGLIALLMSLLATIYPAWKASKVQPACALRYE